MEYLSGGQWHTFPRYVTDSYGLLIDQFNVVHPAEALTCEGLRLKLNPQPGKSVGVAEIKINFVE